MAHEIAIIPGDGIGPEVAEATVRVLEAAGADIRWTWLEAGADYVHKYGDPMPEQVISAVRSIGVALKGPIGTPIGKGFRSANVALRKALDLYAAVRPSHSMPGLKTRYEDVDIVVVRENTEGLYSGLEHWVVPGVAESIKVMTEGACLRISRYAFQYARDNGYPRVTAVHKANIMKISDGLFLECFRRISREYPDIEPEEIIVDNACMQLVTDPSRYHVLVMENLYGDIVSDLCAGMVGGLGVVPGANIGDGCAVFEAVHGSAPDIAGRGLANPTALLLSACMMLDHLGDRDIANGIRAAVHATLGGRIRTRDLGGDSTTRDYTDALIDHLEA